MRSKEDLTRVTTRPYSTDVDNKKVMIIPDFSPFYSVFLEIIFGLVGVKLEVLPESDQKSVEVGLKYTNNEICYPAIICVGDIIKALQSGKYNLDDVYVGITQTGGQCRASNYASLIKKGLLAAGFQDIPVVTSTTGHNALNNISDFKIDVVKLLKSGFLSMLFADSLFNMYNTTAFREINKGQSMRLLQEYHSKVRCAIENWDVSQVLKILKEAINEFNNISIKEGNFPRIGIVGEIYVKFNPQGNNHLVEWLIEQEVEVVIPPLIEFFLQSFINHKANEKYNVKKYGKSKLKSFVIEKYVHFMLRKFNKVMKEFRFYKPFLKITDLAENAEKVLSLVNQYGEGWLIPGEIVTFAESGINNILCLQPFGCLANHIVARGVEKKIKEMHPELNLLFLDMDADTSEVNSLNRLHFLLEGARSC